MMVLDSGLLFRDTLYISAGVKLTIIPYTKE